jgi:hypothetical protein
MKTLTLLLGMTMALLAGFCCGYEYYRTGNRLFIIKKEDAKLPGYTLVSPTLGINSSGDTIVVERFEYKRILK